MSITLAPIPEEVECPECRGAWPFVDFLGIGGRVCKLCVRCRLAQAQWNHKHRDRETAFRLMTPSAGYSTPYADDGLPNATVS